MRVCFLFESTILFNIYVEKWTIKGTIKLKIHVCRFNNAMHNIMVLVVMENKTNNIEILLVLLITIKISLFKIY